MKLKFDDNGNVAVNEKGEPIYVHDDGSEVPFDGAKAFNKISELGKEAQKYREEREKAMEKLKNYEGLDHEEAWKALETVKNLDEKKLVDAGKVEEIKKNVSKTYEEKLKELSSTYESKINEMTSANQELENSLWQTQVNGELNRIFSNPESPHYKKTNLDPFFAQKAFGNHIRVEKDETTGQRVARVYDNNGEVIYSRQNPGNHADIDEGLLILMDKEPFRSSIVRLSGGSGATGNDGHGFAGKVYGHNEWMKKLSTATPEEQKQLTREYMAGNIKVNKPNQ